MQDFTFAPLELKFAGDPALGSFEGYGAVFGNVDAHGDVIAPRAFDESLKARAAQGRTLPMYAMHGFRLGADPLPVGVWTSVQEDDRGLKVAGQIAAMDTEYGRRIYGLVKSGALGGLSVGFSAAKNGVSHGKAPGEPRRTFKRVDIVEISLVDDPANAQARVTAIKSAVQNENRLELFCKALRDGEPRPISEFEDILREAGAPKSIATQIASVGYAKAVRSESEGKANDLAASLALMRAAAASISLRK